MDAKALIKIAAFGVGGYFIYEWLKSSGYLGATASNSFSDTTSLLTYCQANQAGNAIYTGVSPSVTETCAQWLAAASSPPATTPTTTPVNSTPATSAPVNTQPNVVSAPVDPAMVAQLTSLMQAQIGSPNGTISQWNWIEQNKINPAATIISSATQYGNSPITATQYLQLRQSMGLSGLGMGARYGWRSPERWLM